MEEKIAIQILQGFIKRTNHLCEEYGYEKEDEDEAIETLLQSLENKDKEIAQLKLDFKGTTLFCKDCVNKDKEIKELKEKIKKIETICLKHIAICNRVRTAIKGECDQFNQGQEYKCEEILKEIKGE